MRTLETFDGLLEAFEEALELERELGTRTVDCDRALLMPLRPAPPPAPCPASAGQPPKPAAPRPPATVQRPTSNDQSPKSTVQRPTSNDLTDFAFIVAATPQGAAAAMLEKMVAAMGYAMDQVAVAVAEKAATARPRARVYVVLGGSDAFRAFAPGQRAALGLWTTVADVPTIVTYSPARILSYFGDDASGLAKAKRQIWSDLKSALARIGKTPPRR